MTAHLKCLSLFQLDSKRFSQSTYLSRVCLKCTLIAHTHHWKRERKKGREKVEENEIFAILWLPVPDLPRSVTSPGKISSRNETVIVMDGAWPNLSHKCKNGKAGKLRGFNFTFFCFFLKNFSISPVRRRLTLRIIDSSMCFTLKTTNEPTANHTTKGHNHQQWNDTVANIKWRLVEWAGRICWVIKGISWRAWLWGWNWFLRTHTSKKQGFKKQLQLQKELLLNVYCRLM